MDMATSISQIRSVAATRAADLLDRYLSDHGPGAADRLGELVEDFVSPHARRVVGSRLYRHGTAHEGQVEDVTSDAVVSFILYAEELHQGRGTPIGNLEAFVAMLAARASNSYLRVAYPAFHGHRNRLRYLFEKYSDLARWVEAGSEAWVCGLAEWRSARGPRHMALDDVERTAGLEWMQGSQQHRADQLVRLFKLVGRPMLFNDLAVLTARLWDVHELDATLPEGQEFAGSDTPLDTAFDRKQRIGALWSRICDLALNQRVALLLNLKGPDGSCGASLLVATGAASIRQIAQAVEMPPAKFAELWGKLPLEDLEIAAMLNLTRQQVINLRKCARAKLGRGNKLSF